MGDFAQIEKAGQFLVPFRRADPQDGVRLELLFPGQELEKRPERRQLPGKGRLRTASLFDLREKTSD